MITERDDTLTQFSKQRFVQILTTLYSVLQLY